MIEGRAPHGCDVCPAVHLVPVDAPPACCPACGRGTLAPCEVRIEGAPERLIGRLVSRTAAREALARFVAPTPLPTSELDPAVLDARLEPVWLPWWLVDADVAGAWEAEAGFDYEVQSSQEVLQGGTWVSRPVTETRVRWEPRSGRVTRRYANLAVRGLVDQAAIESRVGRPDLAEAAPHDPAALGDGAIRLPDRTPAESWPDAQATLRGLVADDCRRACAAQHIRDVYVDLQADQTGWTWLLHPVWTTWYRDDDGERHVLWVDGVSEQTGGPRRASPAKGLRWALGLGGTAAALVLVGLAITLVGVVIWPLLVAAGVLLLLGLILGCVALWPLFRPRWWNGRPDNQ